MCANSIIDESDWQAAYNHMCAYSHRIYHFLYWSECTSSAREHRARTSLKLSSASAHLDIFLGARSDIVKTVHMRAYSCRSKRIALYNIHTHAHVRAHSPGPKQSPLVFDLPPALSLTLKLHGAGDGTIGRACWRACALHISTFCHNEAAAAAAFCGPAKRDRRCAAPGPTNRVLLHRCKTCLRNLRACS